MNIFDVCVVTAATERQAEAFRELIRRRCSHGVYPREIQFSVYADPEGVALGTAGATAWALRRQAEAAGSSGVRQYLEARRVLLIHAGGAARGLPTFLPEGRLFAPVPLASSSVLPPLLLDAHLGAFLGYPWGAGEVVVAPGDRLVDLGSEELESPGFPVRVLAVPAQIGLAERLAAVRVDESTGAALGYEADAPVALRRGEARLPGTDTFSASSGVVSFSPEAADELVHLVEALGSEEGRVTLPVALRLGLEVLSACLADVDENGYVDSVASRSRLPEPLLRRVYAALHPYLLGALVARSGRLWPMDALDGYLQACRELARRGGGPYVTQDPDILAVVRGEQVCFNSSAAADSPGASCVVEACRDARIAGADGLVVGLEGEELVAPLPPRACVERRDVRFERTEARVLLAYCADDSLYPVSDMGIALLFGIPLSRWLEERTLTSADLGLPPPPAATDLREARLFSPAFDLEFLRGLWMPTKATSAWVRRFRSTPRLSLAQIESAADIDAADRRRASIRAEVLRRSVLEGIGWRSSSTNDLRCAFRGADLPRLRQIALDTRDQILRLYRTEQLRALAAGGPGDASQLDLSADAAPRLSFVGALTRPPLRRAVKADQIVWARSPVRLDLAGGWTDTPPYTNRFGGAVTNVAVNLNGQAPIQVFVRPTAELRVRLHSIDLGSTETVTSVEALRAFSDARGPFSLPKGALCMLGLGGVSAGELEGQLSRIGCGIELTLLSAVPKGSGLGVSSILGGTILGALSRFFGIPLTLNRLFLETLELEQMLTTGGGWQDQVGGLAGGVKYVESRAGARPEPRVYQLDPFLFEDRRSAACMTLFYTGVTRLAKGILQDVVAQVNTADPAYLFTIARHRSLAVEARQAISRRDVANLARIVSAAWSANKLMHPSTTNQELEAMLAETRELASGVKLLGAGGGGFAMFVSDSPRRAEELRDLLGRRFEGERARLFEFDLNGEGLQVTAS